MSGDKDIENQGASDEGGYDDDPAMDVNDPGGFAEDGFADMPEEGPAGEDFAADEFAGDPAMDEDFVEEDWEAYDEESFIDDSDGDGVAERKAAFTKLIIATIVVCVVGVGGYFILTSGKKENLGAPEMEQVAKATEVSPDQRVEFHADTKVPAKDAFGVTYGKEDEVAAPPPKKDIPKEGLLNDPQALARLRAREAAVPTRIVAEKDGNGNISIGERLPMPSPMAQAQQDTPENDEGRFAQMGEKQPRPAPADGLIPMPEKLRGPSAMANGIGSANLPNASDVTLATATGQDQGAAMAGAMGENPAPNDSGGQASIAAAGDETIAPQPGDMAALNAKLDRIADRLEQIDGELDQLDDLKNDVSRLESRMAKLEKAPAHTAARPKPARRPESAAAPKAAGSPPEGSWVLKSAQPGQAMIGRKGASDTYTVSIGETFEGLGKITGIFIDNGRWIVQGTGGRITQ